MSRQRHEKLKDEGTRLQVIAAGAIAGLVSRFCIAPLDVIKIRLQLQVHSLSDPLSYHGYSGPVYKGFFGTLRSILHDEGLTALWKGNIPAELLYLTYGATQFSLYRNTTHALRQLPLDRRLPDAAESFVSGAFAGGVATAMTYPLDLLRTRFAAQGTERVYEGLASSVRDIYQLEGVRGFFQGSSAAVAQIVPFMGLFFATYETLKLPLADLHLPFGSGDAVAGVIASVSSKTAVYPLDTIRKRLQVQGPTRSRYVHRNIPVYQGIRSAMTVILRREGARGLYRGLPVSLVKAAPASAISVWTYERAMAGLRSLAEADEN